MQLASIFVVTAAILNFNFVLLQLFLNSAPLLCLPEELGLWEEGQEGQEMGES